MNSFTHTSRLKAAFICPCIGVGGADAYMLSLVQHTPNIEWTGIAVERHTNKEQLLWVERALGNRCRIHQLKHPNKEMFPNIVYEENMGNVVYGACHDADIIVVWCVEQLNRDVVSVLNKPIVEFTQNTDEHAKRTTERIDGLVNYRVACCESAISTYPEYRQDSVTVIYNAIDPNRVVPRFGRQYIRKAWNIQDDEKVILYMGRLVDEKNPQTVISALTSLPEKYRALFVGTGYRTTDLHRLAQDMLEPGRVMFMDNQYYVGDIFEASDVFVLPSDFEGQPLSVMEAWLSGIPVVCSEFTNAVELRDKFGPLCTYVPLACSGKQLAQGILRAASDDPEVLTERNNAREIVWQNFTMPCVAAQWEEVLHQFLHDWRTRQRFPYIKPVQPKKPQTEATSIVKLVEGR